MRSISSIVARGCVRTCYKYISFIKQKKTMNGMLEGAFIMREHVPSSNYRLDQGSSIGSGPGQSGGDAGQLISMLDHLPVLCFFFFFHVGTLSIHCLVQ